MTQRISGLLAFFLVLVPITSLGAQRTPQDRREHYMKMSEIISRHPSGVDYLALHDIFRQRSSDLPFDHQREYLISSPDKTRTTRILVLVNSALFQNPQARSGIDRYVRDISRGHSCTVVLETVQGGPAEELKSLIAAYFEHGLDGVVMIGRLPAAWFESANDHEWWEGGFGYADWTCDLYFMDLDGEWIDSDGNGRFDDHQPGQGDISPEIFVARIDPATMGDFGEEVELLSRYLDKDHDYWTGAIDLPQHGLIYIDHDWADIPTTHFAALYGLQGYDNLVWNGSADNLVNRVDYAYNRLPSPEYGFTQMWAHASWQGHHFHNGGSLHTPSIQNIGPRSIGYNIDGCSAGDWAAGNDGSFLCGSYIYNDAPTSLVVISTTKSGGMLEFFQFNLPLGQNRCIGRAFCDWMTSRQNSYDDREYIIGWHYGMVLLGDPLICFREVPGLEALHPPRRPDSRGRR